MDDVKKKSDSNGRCSMKYCLSIFVVCLCIVAAVVLVKVMLNSSSKKHDVLTEKAVSHIKSSIDIPETFELLHTERPDSSFGLYWFPVEEEQMISEKALDFAVGMFDKIPYLSKDSLTEEASCYLQVYAPVMQKSGLKMMTRKEKGSFSGWRVKTVYGFSDSHRHRFTLTRWTFFDPKGEKILGVFELPGDMSSSEQSNE